MRSVYSVVETRAGIVMRTAAGMEIDKTGPGKLIYGDETHAIRGACFEVYRHWGCGFLEAVYQESLEVELFIQGIPFLAHPRIRLAYKGSRLNSEYVPDLVCFDRVIVEVKAVSALGDEHRAQLHNYLKASGQRVGLLVNFGHYPGVKIERIVR